MGEAAEISIKVILKRIALDAMFCHFNNMMDLAEKGADGAAIIADRINIAAWRLLYESNAILAALN